MYVFDDCEVDPRRFELRRGGQPVHVEPQVFALLIYLIMHRDRVIAKTELLDSVWGDRYVSESALTSRIKALRRALGDDGVRQRIIATMHGIGYRFVAPVVDVDGQVAAPGARVPQQIRYCVSPDGVRVAYAVSGSGPPLVKAANWLTHLDLEWTSSIWAHWLDGLAQRHTLIRYDERGCGLSDWDVPNFSFDSWVDDLELVVAAAGLTRFPLLGVSQGGAVAIAYAVRHPERVSRMVLVGAGRQAVRPCRRRGPRRARRSGCSLPCQHLQGEERVGSCQRCADSQRTRGEAMEMLWRSGWTEHTAACGWDTSHAPGRSTRLSRLLVGTVRRGWDRTPALRCGRRCAR